MRKPNAHIKSIQRYIASCLAIVLIICFRPGLADAQRMNRLRSNGLIKEGNKNYESKNYPGSQKYYDEALIKDPDSYAGNFNMGDALFKQKKYKEAAESFDRAAAVSKDKTELMSSYYNLGNSYLKQEKIEESIDAYKKALKINPDDLYSKFNLSYAIEKRKRKQQQQQKHPQPRNGDQKPDDKSNQGKKEPKKPENGNKDQQPELKNEPDKDKGKITENDAEQILNALKNDEQKIRQRMNNSQRKQNRYHTDKPW